MDPIMRRTEDAARLAMAGCVPEEASRPAPSMTLAKPWMARLAIAVATVAALYVAGLIPG